MHIIKVERVASVAEIIVVSAVAVEVLRGEGDHNIGICFTNLLTAASRGGRDNRERKVSIAFKECVRTRCCVRALILTQLAYVEWFLAYIEIIPVVTVGRVVLVPYAQFAASYGFADVNDAVVGPNGQTVLLL